MTILVFKKLRLEAFIDTALELIEAETTFHTVLQQKQQSGTQDYRALTAKILIRLLRGPAEEGLDDAFIAPYLDMTRAYLEELIIKKAALDPTAQQALREATLTEEEDKVFHDVLTIILRYLTVVTRDFQDYLD